MVTMYLEMHILQNFAPSNLNRDDTGSPKDCEFGGFRRARISSQCLKRAMRTAMRNDKLLDAAHLSSRTKRLIEEIAERLAAADKDEATARGVAEVALQSVGLKANEEGKTEYLLFLGAREIADVASLCAAHWDALAPLAALAEAQEAGAAKTGRASKKDAKAAIPAEIGTAMRRILDGGKAADLALFGRMLADLPEHNVDAASQVAHAISTNKVSMEFDFYTAVDDLKPDDTAGADMLGTVEFNSACFYRYLNVDVQGLYENMQRDEELARAVVRAYLQAAVDAIPTGKQNSMAAQNPPSLVFVVARERGLWSLANAFVKPIRADGDGDLVRNSIAALDSYWASLTRMYGRRGLLGTWACALDGDGALRHLAASGAVMPSLDEVIDGAVDSVAFEGQGAMA